MEQELEQKIAEFNILDGRLQELEQSFQLLEKQIAELQSCQFSLDELKSTKEGTEMLAPISPGVFVKAKLSNSEDVILDLGARVFCKKSSEKAKEIIQKKLEQVLDIRARIAAEINILMQHLRKLEQELSEKQ